MTDFTTAKINLKFSNKFPSRSYKKYLMVLMEQFSHMGKLGLEKLILFLETYQMKNNQDSYQGP